MKKAVDVGWDLFLDFTPINVLFGLQKPVHTYAGDRE